MINNHETSSLSKAENAAIPTLYQVGERNIILLNELLTYCGKDHEWLNEIFPTFQNDMPTRYCFQIDDIQKWILHDSSLNNSSSEDAFAVTETGALFIISHLAYDNIGEVNKLISEIFSKVPKKPELKLSDEIFSKLKPLQNDFSIEKLEDNISYYHDILEDTFKNKSIRNIAIAAPYGAGKTTITNSFFRNRAKYFQKVIWISLGSFEDEKKDERISNEYERQKVEKNILQQLIYQSDPSQLTESRILRIHEISPSNKRYDILQITVFLLAVCFLYIDKIFPVLGNEIYSIYAALLKIVSIISIALIVPPVIFNIFKSARNIKISKFSTLAGDIELSHGKELSVFNQYMDELLYFFEKTSYDYVVIEDLDRFGDVEIFNRLRSLNQTINNYPRLKGRSITFIYAMRDDIFAKDYRDRTKFFDLIIPIVPIISSSNSKDKFKFLLTKDAIEICELDELFIEEASQHIQDMRLLKNIVNEFLVHWRLLRSNYHYDGNELLAAIIYKNLEPKDFAAFHENKGYLRLLTNFKLYLYNYAESSYPSILKDERDNLLILKDITLKTLINALDGLLGAENPKQDAYLKHIQNILAFTDNERKAPLYDTYLKSPVFLTLLRSGYLNENVEQYISYMHLDSLGFEEQQYVTYLNQRLDPENLTIPINRTIVEKIYISVFEHRVVLIPSLVEYIFTNNGYDIHRKKVVNLLVQQKDKAFNFLDNLLKSDSLEEIISSLVNQWRNFWIYAPAEFLSKAQIQALCPSLPKIENQIEIIKSVEEDKLKTLIDGHKIEFNKENIEFISKSKPNSLAYFLSSNQDKLNEIKREDDWLEKLRRGHPNVSDENLKNLEISLWAEAKGYHDVKDRMKPNTIKNHSFFIHDVSDKAFREIDSNILKVDKGFISIWAFVNQHHLRSKPRYENRYILSHALNKGKKSENMPTDKYFYLAGWAIHLTNPKGPNGQFNCKFFCNKKTEPEHPDDHINKGIIRWGSISTGWHLFTVAWHKRKNYIKFFVNNEEITDKNEDFTYKNYWPDEYSGRINIGCWEDRNDQTHHFNSQIGPFIMVAEELTQETLDTYFAVKPK